MKICNDSFNAETPELASIFARWPFTLSDFQNSQLMVFSTENMLSLLPTQEMVKHFLLISQYRILLNWERR